MRAGEPNVRSWDEIKAFYESRVDAGLRLEAMVRLIDQITSSPYRSLYAWTSMHDLCITQTSAPYPHEWPYLRISPLFDGRVEFRYIDTHVEQKQWSRIVAEDAAFERLERFFQQLNWFPIPKANVSSPNRSR
jgi:hypothetical protein